MPCTPCLVARDVIETRLDDVRRDAHVGHLRRHRSPQIVVRPMRDGVAELFVEAALLTLQPEKAPTRPKTNSRSPRRGRPSRMVRTTGAIGMHMLAAVLGSLSRQHDAIGGDLVPLQAADLGDPRTRSA